MTSTNAQKGAHRRAMGTFLRHYSRATRGYNGAIEFTLKQSPDLSPIEVRAVVILPKHYAMPSFGDSFMVPRKVSKQSLDGDRFQAC